MRRYDAILRGAPARHVILKQTVADADFKSLGDAALSEYHDMLMAEQKIRAKGPLWPRQGPVPMASLLDVKIELAGRMLKACHFCERRCHANRLEKPGACGVDAVSHFSSEFLHMGEEPDLIPSHTIFFEGCNFACAYCQNWTIAREVHGMAADADRMAKLIAMRHRQGSANVNFVGGDPTPHLHTILRIIRETDVNIPVIWNSNMYLTPGAMRLLDGAVDLYLADFRYGSNDHARRYSGIDDYWEIATRNFLEAKRQADVLVRLLVLPGHVECCAKPIIEWCADRLGRDVRFNLMFQYRPEHNAPLFPEINRPLSSAEIDRATALAKDAGLTNLV